MSKNVLEAKIGKKNSFRRRKMRQQIEENRRKKGEILNEIPCKSKK